MNLNNQETIKNLQEAIKKDDHNEVYEYSNILLKQSPDDEDYQQCLIISALKINLLDELQHMFKVQPSKQSLKRLYAYYLYFTGQYSKVISYINNLQKTSKLNAEQIISYKLLLAQTYFKTNSLSQSSKQMLQIIQKNKLSSITKQDLQMYLVNLFATSINQNFDKQTFQKYKFALGNDYCRQVKYNYSLIKVQLKQYQQAKETLNLIQKQLMKGRDDQDFIMISTLRDFISFKQLQSIDAQLINTKIQHYQKMDEQTSEVNLKSVIRNNKLFLKYRDNQHHLQNFHEIIKTIDQGLQKKSKMTKPQQLLLKQNKLSLLLRKNRFSQSFKLLKDIESNYQYQIYLKNNIQFIKSKYYLFKKNKDHHFDLNGWIHQLKNDNQDLAFCLMADFKRDDGKETDIISQLKATHYPPLIKNYIFSLLIKNPELFDQYHQYLEQLQQKTQDTKILQILLKLYQSKKDITKQQSVLKKILKVNPKDIQSKVLLAQIYLNQSQITLAQQLLKGVTQPQQVSDISYLQHIQKNIHVSKQQQAPKKATIQTIDHHQKRIKKTRKPKYPKNLQKITIGFKADPQRWLPKWQRKGYKKRGKKGMGKTQGLATVGRDQTKNVFTTNASTSAKDVTRDVQKKRK